MSKPHERVIALTLALLFFATSVGTGFAVFWQIHQEKEAQKVRDVLAAQNQTADTTQDSTTNDAPSEENKLEGTKLAGFTPVAKVDQLQSTDLIVGTGDVVQPGATITAHYTGALASDGTIFQSSHDTGSPATFSLSQVIKGWADGVPGMKVGGTRRLLIPAAQAYGDQSPSPNIPPNSDLVFDIELISIGQ